MEKLFRRFPTHTNEPNFLLTPQKPEKEKRKSADVSTIFREVFMLWNFNLSYGKIIYFFFIARETYSEKCISSHGAEIGCSFFGDNMIFESTSEKFATSERLRQAAEKFSFLIFLHQLQSAPHPSWPVTSPTRSRITCQGRIRTYSARNSSTINSGTCWNSVNVDGTPDTY